MSFYERKRRNYNRSNKNIWKWWFKWNIKERHEEVDINYTYTYNNFNRLDKVLKNNLEYRRYEYDNIGRITKVYKEGTLYKSYNYLENNLNPYSINISGTNYDITWVLQLLCYKVRLYIEKYIFSHFFLSFSCVMLHFML